MMNKEPVVEPVKLIAGFIYASEEALVSVLEKMENAHGPVESESEHFPFTHTDYYDREMGPELRRCFISFEPPIAPDMLRECKLAAVGLEKKYLNADGGRMVNIDPGLIGLSNLVLASTKAFAHRVYLGKGIYGEVSMLYEDREFVPLRWTYPDYRQEEATRFFLQVRERLKEQIGTLRQSG